MNLSELADYTEHFRTRVLADALQEAMSNYWLRRAHVFTEVGTEGCDEIARACRNKAALALGGDGIPNAVICHVCDTPTSPWTCSCGTTRLHVGPIHREEVDAWREISN